MSTVNSTSYPSASSLNLRRADVLEADGSNGVLTVSVCAGFAAADVRDVGPSVTVTVDRYHGLDVALHKT
jgi:microcystin degradation protein MlrC